MRVLPVFAFSLSIALQTGMTLADGPATLLRVAENTAPICPPSEARHTWDGNPAVVSNVLTRVTHDTLVAALPFDFAGPATGSLHTNGDVHITAVDQGATVIVLRFHVIGDDDAESSCEHTILFDR